jgi:hypothetical protein
MIFFFSSALVRHTATNTRGFDLANTFDLFHALSGVYMAKDTTLQLFDFLRSLETASLEAARADKRAFSRRGAPLGANETDLA